MALNSILSQLNGLRAGYGGQAMPGVQATQAQGLNFQAPTANPMGNAQQPATFNYTGPMQTGLNGLYARPGQLDSFMPGLTGPTQKPSYANAVNSSAAPSWFDTSSYTPTARAWPTGMPTPTDPLTGQPVGVRGLGTISPKTTQRVGLLPSGTDLNNQALFGSLNPGMGWAPSWSEIADAWGSSGQVPIDYMLPYAKEHTARQVTEMLGSGASAADVWGKEGERLLRDFFNPKVPKDLNKAKGRTAYDAALAQWMASQPEMRFALR